MSAAKVQLNALTVFACASMTVACPGDSGTGTTSDSASGAATMTTMSAPTSTATQTSTSTSNSSSGMAGTTGPASSCGDGLKDETEGCDDANMINGDGCNVDCTPSAELLWQYRSDASNNDVFFGVAVTPDSRIFAAGAQIPGSQDRWLVQFSSEGDIVWSKTYDMANFEALQAVATDMANIYVAGMLKEDTRQLWIGRLDLMGEIVWEDSFSSAFGDAYATGLTLTSDGVVVAGVSTIEGGGGEIWTRRYGLDGAIKWTESVGYGAPPSYYVGPAVSADAEQIVVGFKTNPGPAELLLAYGLNGGAPLLNSTPMMSLRAIGGIAQAANGDILIGAYGEQAGQMLVRRHDSAGKLLWSSPDCVGDIAESLAVDGQGDIIVVGSGPGSVGRNIRLCKFTSEGDLRWGKDIDGGEGNDDGLAVAVLPDNRIVAAGSMDSMAGKLDAWLAVYSP